MGRSARRQRAFLALWLAAVVAAFMAFTPAAGSKLPKCADRNLVPTKANIHQAQEAVICLVNQERAKHGRRPLRDNHKLTKAAGRHSRDMVKRRYFAHDSPSGRDLVDRVMAAHWTKRNSSWRVGENIAFASGDRATPKHIVGMWMHSPGHRANILDRHFREGGTGIAVGSPQSRHNGATYTMDYGARGS